MLHKEGGSKPIDFSIKMPKIKTARDWKNFSRRAELKVSQDIRRAVFLLTFKTQPQESCQSGNARPGSSQFFTSNVNVVCKCYSNVCFCQQRHI